MIYLKHDTVNKVALTLNESLLVSGTPSFLFEFIREWDKQVFTYSYTDVSNASYIFNLFDIELNDSANATQSVIDGAVKMVPGQYVYNVYDTSILLETGMLIVEKKEVGSVNQNPQNIYY